MAPQSPPIMLTDSSIEQEAAERGRHRVNMRIKKLPAAHGVNISERLEIFQELAESGDPEFSTDGRLAFKEAFGVELKDVVAILVPSGFDESIQLPESIRIRLVVQSDGSITDMTRAPAA